MHWLLLNKLKYAEINTKEEERRQRRKGVRVWRGEEGERKRRSR